MRAGSVSSKEKRWGKYSNPRRVVKCTFDPIATTLDGAEEFVSGYETKTRGEGAGSLFVVRVCVRKPIPRRGILVCFELRSQTSDGADEFAFSRETKPHGGGRVLFCAEAETNLRRGGINE